MSKQLSDPLVLSVPQAAALLGISTRSAYNLCRQADFPAFHLTENRIGVSRVGLEVWVASKAEKGGMR